jgi:hypothetical protein
MTEQEPVAWMMLENKLVPIYIAPPQREWQGLTDEELKEIYRQDGLIFKPLKFYRAIEAKLKEKNT